MGFTENWFRQPARDTLAALAASAPDGMVLEIGAWEGRSTVVIANTVAPRILHTVDTWAGASTDITGELAAQRDVHAVWQANVAELTVGNVIGHRMGWRDFVPTIDGPVGFCFIDAEHTYTEVADNINALLPLLSDDAVLCGDDAGHPPVAEALADTLGGAVDIDGVVWSWKMPGRGDR